MSLSCDRVAMALAVAMVLLAAAPYRAVAITCSDVYTPLYPCLGYIQGGVAEPDLSCCSGVSRLMAAAKTAADRRTTCGCLKSVAAGVSPQYLALAGGLPAKCGVKIPYKISTSTDCAKVK